MRMQAGQTETIPQLLVVLVTCPTVAVARRIAERLVRDRVAACVNLVPSVQSLFLWQGALERSREVLLVIKTTRRRFERLRRCLLLLHPYELPEIIALPVVAGHPPYERWVHEVTRAAVPDAASFGKEKTKQETKRFLKKKEVAAAS